MYKCPMCSERVAFRQKALVENVFNGNGRLVDQKTLKEYSKVTCDMCNHSGKEKDFEFDDDFESDFEED